jgi:hypothetical protein
MAAARRRSTGAAQASSPRTGFVGSNLGGRRLREFGYLKDLAITRADTPPSNKQNPHGIFLLCNEATTLRPVTGF